MRDIHAEITATILEQLEAVTPGDFKLPWHQPVGGGIPLNILTKRPYRGGNSLFLMIMGLGHKYSTNQWATFKQWQELDARVIKGQKAVPISVPMVFNREDDDGEENSFVRYKVANVFNRDQVEGYTDPKESDLPEIHDLSPVDKAESLVVASGAKITVGGHRAFYDIRTDAITMPDRERFFATATSTATESWYSTLLHELVHWTGAVTRLDRKGFGLDEKHTKPEYAFEELIAEFGAAFLSAHTGVSAQLREDHTTYIAQWISVLKSDKKAFFKAAAAAEKATDYLLAQYDAKMPAEAA